MIHEEICTYEVCKLAKEKGFREKCIDHYYDDTKDLYRSSNPQCYNFGGNTSDAPTQSLLQRWLREEKGIWISVEAHPMLYAIKNTILCVWTIKYRSLGHSVERQPSLNTFSTYELALEDALKYALENLV